MQEKPIALIWGLGPSYRKRVKSTIETALNSGYDNIMEFIILTDVPEDFYELRDTSKKIIDILNNQLLKFEDAKLIIRNLNRNKIFK
jgi:hypothetical protein